MTIRDLITEYLNLITKAPSRFFGSIDAIEKKVVDQLLQFILKFDTQDGRFSTRKKNNTVFLEVNSLFKRAWRESGIRDDLAVFLEDFDLVDKLSKQFYRETLRRPDQTELTRIFKESNPRKALAIEQITNRLVNFDSISQGAFDQIKNDIYQAIIFKQSVDKLQQNIRTTLISKEGANSKILRYVKQVSNDTLLQYERTKHNEIRTEFDLDGMLFANSIIKTTRQTCIWCVNGSGPLKEFALRPGVYKVEDMEEIVAILAAEAAKIKHSGWIPGTDKDSWPVVLNGWQCRHVLMFMRLIDEDFL